MRFFLWTRIASLHTAFGYELGYELNVRILSFLLAMMLAVAAVLHTVVTAARLLAEQPFDLAAGHVKDVLASGLIARHAGAHLRFRLLAAVLANVAALVKPVARYRTEDDRLHSSHIPKLNLRDVE